MTLLQCLRSMRALTPPAKESLILELNILMIQANLDLCKQNLSLEDLTNLAQALAKNNTVRYLELRDNAIDDKGAMVLVALLETNASIQSIDLRDNHITQLGALALTKILRASTSALIELDLRQNKITRVGCQAIADACAISHRQINGKEWSLSDEASHAPEICSLFEYARHQAPAFKRLGTVLGHLQEVSKPQIIKNK